MNIQFVDLKLQKVVLTGSGVGSLHDYYPSEMTSVFIEIIQLINLNFGTQMSRNCEIPSCLVFSSIWFSVFISEFKKEYFFVKKIIKMTQKSINKG